MTAADEETVPDRTGSGTSRGVLGADRRHTAAPAGMVWVALGTVYVVWGSTYMAIRVAIDTMPPMLMASVGS